MLTADRREALQEIANIGMGQAGASIARALNRLVLLSIPRVNQLAPDELPGALRQAMRTDPVTAVGQPFRGALHGEAIVLYGAQQATGLAELMGHGEDADCATERKLLLQLSSLLVDAFLDGIANQLGVAIECSPPTLLATARPLQSLFGAHAGWKRALLVEVNFRLETRSFSCHLIALLPDSESAALAAVVDNFLEKL